MHVNYAISIDIVIARTMKGCVYHVYCILKSVYKWGVANYTSKYRAVMLEAIICVLAHRLSLCYCITMDIFTYTLLLPWLLQLSLHVGGGNP